MIAWATHPGVIKDEGAGAFVYKCCQPSVESYSLAVNALAFWICMPRHSSLPWLWRKPLRETQILSVGGHFVVKAKGWGWTPPAYAPLTLLANLLSLFLFVWRTHSSVRSYLHILVFYHCMTKCHEFTSLNLNSLIGSWFSSIVDTWVGSAGFLYWGYHKVEIRLPRLFVAEDLSWGSGNLFQAHSDYWQDSVPCGCRTEVLIFLLVVSWELLSISRGYPPSFSRGPTHL